MLAVSVVYDIGEGERLAVIRIRMMTLEMCNRYDGVDFPRLRNIEFVG
jgi:hypothetical protein